MRIQFISQSLENVPTAKGSYDKMTVTFKNLANNKVEVKNLMSFGTPKEVWERLVSAQKNDAFSITTEKDAKGYWQWKELARDDGEVPAAVETPKKMGTWDEKNKLDKERFDFDKQKQHLIIRQSCLASAVELVKDHGKQPDVQAVLEVAKQFETWVWASGVADLNDDVPL